jgi:uncharacterized protein
MKKRQRKKLYLKEFMELGFNIIVEFKSDITREMFNEFIDTFVSEVIDPNGLTFDGGGKENKFDIFVLLEKRGSLDKTHQEKVATWLSSRKDIESYEVGELEDAWT